MLCIFFSWLGKHQVCGHLRCKYVNIQIRFWPTLAINACQHALDGRSSWTPWALTMVLHVSNTMCVLLSAST